MWIYPSSPSLAKFKRGMKYTPFADLRWAHTRVRLPAGGLVGRAAYALMRIPHASVSEAHALLTVRDQELRLQALRGSLQIGGRSYQEVPLRDGLEIHLSDEVMLTVMAAVVPRLSLALLSGGSICSIPRLPCSVLLAKDSAELSPDGEVGEFILVHGRVPSAPVIIYEDSAGLWSQFPDQPPTQVQLPREWNIGGHKIRLVTIPLHLTPNTAGGIRRTSLRIKVRFDTVHILPESAHEPTVITGIPARIISEVALLGNGPVNWEVVAREIWSRDEDRLPLRDKWDKALQRLRRSLRLARIREDLIRIDRHGNVETLLYPNDTVNIETGDA